MSSHQAAAEGPIGPPHIHHMDTPTAYEAAKLGMWLFLATEILLFGGLFAAFAVFHWMYPEAFHQPINHVDSNGVVPENTATPILKGRANPLKRVAAGTDSTKYAAKVESFRANAATRNSCIANAV